MHKEFNKQEKKRLSVVTQKSNSKALKFYLKNGLRLKLSINGSTNGTSTECFQ